MDDQSRDRVLKLATQAGMLLEDTSAKLILLPGEPTNQIQQIIENSALELECSIELLRSAQSIAE